MQGPDAQYGTSADGATFESSLSAPPPPPLQHQRTEASVSVPSYSHATSSSSSSALNPFTQRPFTQAYIDILRGRQRLPVYEKCRLIQETVLAHPVTLLVGETGSGKTTQVPQFIALLRSHFSGYVACTQPRRIAAISVATRVAAEMDVSLGEEVGYHVRFQSARSARTKVLYLTDGMLLREAFSDADLGAYSVVVVDEAHERTVDTDVVLGLMKRLVVRRPTFRLVVMSATLDVAKIQAFFPGAPLVQVSGRMYDVDVLYAPQPVKDYVAASVSCIWQLHESEPAGDILCFLTGEAEIEKAVAATREALGKAAVKCVLEDSSSRKRTSRDEDTDSVATAASGHAEGTAAVVPRPTEAVVLPLYGSLSLSEQEKVFKEYPSHVRKIVFATNIAETSVTIDGVVYVVDCGYQKQSLYSADGCVDYLLPAVISKASAEQRKGRAGRTRPGKCLRMFTVDDFSAFPAQTHPEILRTNITNTILLLLKLGVDNVLHFPFIDAPSDSALSDAFYQLLYFGAVDDELQLTDFGKKMAELPLDACLARMLLKAADHGCAGDAAVVAAMLQCGNVFSRPVGRAFEADRARSRFQRAEGDHITLFFVFHGYYRNQHRASQYCFDHYLRYQALNQAVQVYAQLRRLMTALAVPVASTYDEKANTVDTVALRRAILEGFFTQVAYLSPGASVYKTVRNHLSISLHRQSVLADPCRRKPTWLMYDRIEVQGGADGTFARCGSAVEVEWLLKVSDLYSNPADIGDSEIALVLTRAASGVQDKIPA